MTEKREDIDRKSDRKKILLDFSVTFFTFFCHFTHAFEFISIPSSGLPGSISKILNRAELAQCGSVRGEKGAGCVMCGVQCTEGQPGSEQEGQLYRSCCAPSIRLHHQFMVQGQPCTIY